MCKSFPEFSWLPVVDCCYPVMQFLAETNYKNKTYPCPFRTETAVILQTETEVDFEKPFSHTATVGYRNSCLRSVHTHDVSHYRILSPAITLYRRVPHHYTAPYSSHHYIVHIQGGPKNGATLHFPKYLENYWRWVNDFLHTSRQVYAEHGIFTRILVIHFIQWRHLANIEQ